MLLLSLFAADVVAVVALPLVLHSLTFARTLAVCLHATINAMSVAVAVVTVADVAVIFVGVSGVVYYYCCRCYCCRCCCCR